MSLRSNIVPLTWKRTRERIIVSCIVVAVLMHPTLTRRAVQLLTCDELDGGAYLRSDLEVTCWEGAHVFWALFVGLPFLIIYACGIPLVSWYVLFKRRHKLAEARDRKLYTGAATRRTRPSGHFQPTGQHARKASGWRPRM